MDEARKHVSEMKVTYSNHYNHLEAEVARLNKKVIEEREERERSNRDGQRMVENLKLQVSRVSLSMFCQCVTEKQEVIALKSVFPCNLKL